MKKRFCGLLSVAMMLSILTGCADSDQGQTPKNDNTDALTFTWWGNQTRNERTQKILDMYSEENPQITFDPQFAEYNDYWNKLATAAAGNALPDIIQMDYSYLEQYVSNDLLVDLTPYIENGTIDVSNVDEDILNSAKIGNGVYALCNGINVPAMLYNKTLLDEIGLTVKDNMTIDEFIDISKQVYEKTGYKTNIAYGDDTYIDYYCRAFDEIIYQSDSIGATEQTLEEFYSLYEDGMKEGWLLNPSVFAEITIGSVEQNPMVYGSNAENMSWCFLAYSNSLASVEAAAPDGMEIGMTTWPSPNPQKSNYLKPSQFFAISKDSKNPDEAAKVLNYITNSIECNNVLLGERGVPISSVVSEAISENLTPSEQYVVKFINDVVIPNSTKISPPAPTSASEAYVLNESLIEQVCYGQITASQAAKQMVKEGNNIMKN